MTTNIYRLQIIITGVRNVRVRPWEVHAGQGHEVDIAITNDVRNRLCKVRKLHLYVCRSLKSTRRKGHF